MDLLRRMPGDIPGSRHFKHLQVVVGIGAAVRCKQCQAKPKHQTRPRRTPPMTAKPCYHPWHSSKAALSTGYCVGGTVIGNLLEVDDVVEVPTHDQRTPRDSRQRHMQRIIRVLRVHDLGLQVGITSFQAACRDVRHLFMSDVLTTAGGQAGTSGAVRIRLR